MSQVTIAQTEILNTKSPWRVYWRNGPRLAGADGAYKIPHDRFDGYRNADPATGWTEPEFDDKDWSYRGIEGAWDTGGMPMICSRARFGVADPSKVSGLSLTIAYRGGVIVYANGKEVGRSHMPKGQVNAETLADDYPDDVFLKPDGTRMPLFPPGSVVPAELKEVYGMRTRTITLAVPATALRKGINVLAIENHRSACYRATGYGQPDWPTSGVEDLHLTSPNSTDVTPNVEIPKGVHVWNAGLMRMIGYEVSRPDPLVELAPVRLLAPLNGEGSGQVVVSTDTALEGLTATCSDLVAPDGSKIPSNVVCVRYARDGGTYVRHTNPFDALEDKPMADARLQPVWVTATVPADAKPGVYEGTLSFSGPTSVKVQIELTVHGWTLPDHRQWKGKSSFFQSPENLAKYYKVPLWSDAHFKLIEQSLILQGRLGDRVAHVLAVGADTGNASLGAETMVIYRHDGNKVTPDFTAVDRYLRLYKKHVGDPVAVVLHVWTIHSEKGRNPRPDRSLTATFGTDDKMERGTIPFYNDPTFESLWNEVVAGMKRTTKNLEWPEHVLQLGMSEDTQPSKDTTDFFNKHFPDIKWALLSHMQNLPSGFKLGVYYGPAGYGDYMNNRKGWKDDRTWFTLQRGLLDVNAPLTTFRFSPLAALLTGADGPGGNGMDRWEDKATKCYGLGWGQIMRGNPSSLLAPGTNGPIPTVRYELMRAGFCEAQAMIYVDDNATNPKLPPALAARAKAVCPRLLRLIASVHSSGTGSWDSEIGNLYQTAAEIQTAVGDVP